MAVTPPPPHPPLERGQLPAQVMHFARLLRGAGLPIGSDRVQAALVALQVAGLASEADFHAVLGACLLDRNEHRPLFDQAFTLFWHDRDRADAADGLPALPIDGPAEPPPPANRRLAEALWPQPPELAPESPDQPPQRADLSWQAQEALRQADFNNMSTDEWREAQRLLASLRLVFEPLPTRRQRRATRPGVADWRATLAAMARHGGELWQGRWRAPRRQPAPLVLLADISGSMSAYSRMLLHFAHALSQAGGPVESFVFGTRLTRTTRLLQSRDPDIAVGQVVRTVADWSGGTRITQSLHEFNQRWARRVLSGRATVLLISDGLEAGDTQALGFEMERLHKSCRRLIWLNPLLRYARFEPKAGGIRAMLQHVDQFLPAHNLQSLADLVGVLGGLGQPRLMPRPMPRPTPRPQL